MHYKTNNIQAVLKAQILTTRPTWNCNRSSTLTSANDASKQV